MCERNCAHRCLLPWGAQLAPLWEAAYDRWPAEADGPGLETTPELTSHAPHRGP